MFIFLLGSNLSVRKENYSLLMTLFPLLVVLEPVPVVLLHWAGINFSSDCIMERGNE